MARQTEDSLRWNEDHVTDDEPDHDRAGAWLDAVVERFAASPEAEQLEDEPGSWMDLVQRLCLNYLGLSLGRVTPDDLAEVLLEWVPRKVTMPPSGARPMLAEVRAFMAFAAREFDAPEAARNVEFLSPDVEREVERRLGDPSFFGMAKSFTYQGEQAGFDISSQEGLEAWSLVYNAAQRTRREAENAATERSKKKARKKRKMQKKSRRRNR